MLRVYWYAVYRTNLYALTGFKMTNAFCASGPVYFVDFHALENCIIRATRLTDVAVNTFVRNDERHVYSDTGNRKSAIRLSVQSFL